MDEHIFINVEEASEIMHICKDNVRKLARQPGFPAIKIGKRYIIDKNKLYQWMEEHLGREVIIE